ncbi:carboxypeptidase regulatory-like domain-containing protein [Pirellulimonas nuda]|uniref:carboxypeptidase regulatory-like domain-containing protein n=1 Tax=Pirellulimonas nuda TaxID=2528009 RepID=UPI0011A858E3|nr:carboxypeptidase regulatory-like domain-containing protein [Pirellulimonas nuda]
MDNFRRRGVPAMLLGIALCGLIGCGDGRPVRVPVSGVVLIDGAPLTHGSILFFPEQGRPGGGAIGADGTFTASCYEPGDGLPPGKYRVQVKATEPMGEVAQRWHAPQKYASPSTSGLEVDVDSAIDDLKIELQWDGGKPFVERF